jgi:hypothetical protein
MSAWQFVHISRHRTATYSTGMHHGTIAIHDWNSCQQLWVTSKWQHTDAEVNGWMVDDKYVFSSHGNIVKWRCCDAAPKASQLSNSGIRSSSLSGHKNQCWTSESKVFKKTKSRERLLYFQACFGIQGVPSSNWLSNWRPLPPGHFSLEPLEGMARWGLNKYLAGKMCRVRKNGSFRCPQGIKWSSGVSQELMRISIPGVLILLSWMLLN